MEYFVRYRDGISNLSHYVIVYCDLYNITDRIVRFLYGK